MRILFDLGHPAHYHLFRHAMRALRDSGGDVVVFARQKDCLCELLDSDGWSYHVVPRSKRNLLRLGVEAVRILGRVVAMARRRPFDLMVGTSIIVAPAARLTGATSVVFSEDDATAVPLFAKLAYKPAHYVVTPACLGFENHGAKHLTYPGYHELAYLHPNRYRPDESVRELLGVRPDEKYFLVRLVALTAHHDIGEKGLSAEQVRAVVEKLSARGTVFVSSESALTRELGMRKLPTPAGRIFDVLAGAELVVGDSQTVAAEAAVLGTPALRCNSFVGRLSYLEELQDRFGLTVGLRPERFDELMTTLDAWLNAPDLKAQWRARRDAMLAECVDLTDWMLDLFARLSAERSGAPLRPRLATP